jgi:hypothetical protein
MNLPGHDHSGGLMGNPFQHTVWSMPYGRQNAANTGTDTVHEGPHTYLSATTGRAAIEYIPVSGWSWCRVFIPPGKVYEYLTPEFLLYSVDYDVDATCYVRAWNGREYASAATTITNNTENQFVSVSSTVPFIPGTVQTFGWRVKFDNTGGGGDPDVAVLSVALHQTSTTP